MDEKQRYEAGMQVRRAVLGDAHVDRSLQQLTPFNEEFQAWRVIISWNSSLKGVSFSRLRSTWASPSTARRTCMPAS